MKKSHTSASRPIHTDTDKLQGIVFNIQDYSIHDGPGIRTVVFLKGCPLACRWCSNPESQVLDIELGFMRSLCQGCLTCLNACPVLATTVDEQGWIRFDRRLCRACGRCEIACPHNARKLYGRRMSVPEVLEEISKSAPFYTRSGGGATFSGGEPTFQWRFLQELLRRCRQKFIHTALETCGFVGQDVLQCLIPDTDLFLYDIKCMDERKHLMFTGVSNRLILENARFISSQKKEMVIRVPLVPDVNDSIDDLKAIGLFALGLQSVSEVNLLPYHELGRSKYAMLDKPYPYEAAYKIEGEKLAAFKKVFEGMGLKCRVD